MADRTSAAQRAGQPAAPDGLIGRTISGRYTIRSLIARGGMGKVYLAEQAPLGRACALKVLNPNYQGDSDPEFERRFFLEASVASKLHHPNTVTIFDYGKSDDGILFIAMEYLEGSTLHRAIRETGGIGEERTCHIARQMCRALREAHALGVIHRDLKPANVFLVTHGDETDFVKLLDFGLVKNLDEKPDDQLTKTGLFMGSPKYMAPEQIQGDPVDARTDIYSLGVMLYEMLCGHVPFERATSLNILMAHVNEDPPPMASHKPDLVVSQAVEALVMRCLSKEPDDRHSSMDELLRDLKTISGTAGTSDYQSLGGLRSGSGASWRPSPGTLPPPSFSPRAFGPHGNLGASGSGASGAASGTGPSGAARAPSGSSPPIAALAHPYPPLNRTPSGSSPAMPYGAPGQSSFTPPPVGVQQGAWPPAPQTPRSLPPPAFGTTGHTPAAVSRGEDPDPSEINFRPRRRSSLLFVAALLAIGVGGFTGFLVMRARNPEVSTVSGTESTPPPRVPSGVVAPLPTPVVAPTASTVLAASEFARLRITTEPPGATVREKGAEVCLATPCELTYRGAEAAPAAAHELVIAKAGYVTETRTSKVADGSIAVVLSKKAHGAKGGSGQGAPKSENGSGGSATPTPSGFKDVPY